MFLIWNKESRTARNEQTRIVNNLFIMQQVIL